MKFISIISSFFVSILLISSSLFLLLKDWRDHVNRTYSFVSFFGFGILFTMFLTYAFPDSPYLTQLNRITQMSFIIFSSGLVIMSLVFPVSDRRITYKHVIPILAPAFIIGYIAVFTDLNIKKAYFEGEVLVREFGFFYTIYLLAAVIYVLTTVSYFIYKYFKTKIEIHKLQLRYIFISSFSIIFAVIFSVIFPRFYNYSDLYALGPAIASFFSVGAFFYGIVSYNMLDITTIMRRIAIYFVITILIFLPLYGLIEIYNISLGVIFNFPKFVFEGLLVIIFIGYSLIIQPVIYRTMERKRYRLERTFDDFIVNIITEIKDFKVLIQRNVDFLFETLSLQNAFFVIYNNNTQKYEKYYSKGEDNHFESFERNSTIIGWFLRNNEILNLDRVYNDDKSFGEDRNEVIEFFYKNKIKIILPIFHGRRIFGLFCLGSKVSLVTYKLYELLKLRFFQKECNVHITNSLANEEAMREELKQRTIDLSAVMLSKSVPMSLPNLMGIQFGAFFIPKYKDGVDYFDFLRPGSQGVGIIATDIPGIGIDSAMQSVLLRSSFQSSISEAPSTYSVIQRLNKTLNEYYKEKSDFINAYYLYYDIKFKRLIYTNAGFPALEVFRIEKNDFDSLDTEGTPLGHDPAASYGMGRTNLLRGDIGVLYSSALTDSKNQEGENFGLSRLRALISENRSRHPSEIVENVKNNFISFLGLSSLESSVLLVIFKII